MIERQEKSEQVGVGRLEARWARTAAVRGRRGPRSRLGCPV